MAGAQAGAGVSVTLLVGEDEILPVRVALEGFLAAKEGRRPAASGRKIRESRRASSWENETHRAWRLQLRDELVERRSADGGLARELLDGVGAPVIHDARVAVLHQAPHHVCTHAPETDHSELHRCLLLKIRCAGRILSRPEV
jgi:hypothetical protein